MFYFAQYKCSCRASKFTPLLFVYDVIIDRPLRYKGLRNTVCTYIKNIGRVKGNVSNYKLCPNGVNNNWPYMCKKKLYILFCLLMRYAMSLTVCKLFSDVVSCKFVNTFYPLWVKLAPFGFTSSICFELAWSNYNSIPFWSKSCLR